MGEKNFRKSIAGSGRLASNARIPEQSLQPRGYWGWQANGQAKGKHRQGQAKATNQTKPGGVIGVEQQASASTPPVTQTSTAVDKARSAQGNTTPRRPINSALLFNRVYGLTFTGPPEEVFAKGSPERNSRARILNALRQKNATLDDRRAAVTMPDHPSFGYGITQANDYYYNQKDRHAGKKISRFIPDPRRKRSK